MMGKVLYRFVPTCVALLSLQLTLPATAQKYSDSKPVAAQAASRSGAARIETGNTASPVTASPDYIIGAEDVLAISVWKETELSRNVPVRPDGKITLPLVGDVVASGLTAKQLQASLEQQLKSYMENPQVAVIVQEVKAQQYNLLGEVQRPGAYPLGKPVTVLDAIALGGGFRDFAKTNKIYILRGSSSGARERIHFNYKEVIKGEKFEQNVALLPGDTIVVP